MEKGKVFVFYVPKKGISLSHALLISMDIFSNLPGIIADSSSIDRGLINLLIHVSHILREEYVVPIQLIIIGVNYLVVALEQFVLFFQMFCLGLFFLEFFVKPGHRGDRLKKYKSLWKKEQIFDILFF
jgi:amino acid permease